MAEYNNPNLIMTNVQRYSIFVFGGIGLVIFAFTFLYQMLNRRSR